jgi:hypothetical protein
VTDPFEDEFIDERRPTATGDRARRGVLGLSIGVLLGVVVVAAVVGALILVYYALLPPGSLN